MISIFFLAVCVVLAILGGAGFGFWLQRHLSNKRIGDANDLAQRIVEEARKEAQAQKRKFLSRVRTNCSTRSEKWKMNTRNKSAN